MPDGRVQLRNFGAKAVVICPMSNNIQAFNNQISYLITN